MTKHTSRASVAWLIASAALAVTACSRTEPAAEPVRAVKTATIGSEATGATLEYAAEVRSRTESRLGFRVGGKIARRNVDLGDSVKAGQVLAQLDPQDARLGQDAARAALAAAQVNRDQASADLKRFQGLKDQGFISAADLDRRESTLKSAQSALDQARAQAALQGNQATYSSLVADAAGVITAVEAEPGMVVAAGAPVLRLAHDGPRDVVFSVPEDKLALLKAMGARPGALKVRFWGHDELYDATLREVAAAADPATRTFLVKADVGRVPVQLGQTAAVLFELPKVDGAIRVPLASVAQSQGKSVVWVLDKTAMTVSPQAISVGGADGNSVLVAGGLSVGQVIVVAGTHTLTAGEKVKLYVDPTPPTAASVVAR